MHINISRFENYSTINNNFRHFCVLLKLSGELVNLELLGLILYILKVEQNFRHFQPSVI